MKLAIVLPAYNEEEMIFEVVKSIPKKLPGISQIKTIVVDDGSQDRTAQLARQAGAKVLRHIINLGVGSAYKTGLQYAKNQRYDIVATMDADGQHSPNDLKKIIKPIVGNKADVVIGTRMKNPQAMPVIKILGNWIMNCITYLFSGIWTTDSQSGFRAYNKKALSLIRPKTSGYEICTEMFSEIKKYDLRFSEIPIKVIYTKHSRSKGQSIANAVNIITNLLKRNL
ncbi:MAG: family 2 glycosyl transferase [Candidatus Berkelbacteria bacterium Licking1014_7]|uniref:Family 2 glycosyl transferase n=1 Tax=Candidatus Berkelbacteria bacterium Licking1014_7 TaxID=2017147 RepID=A0A554LJQ5_9BACT|nr:MAG: family 2 glycosyl transferase [Candidatus Berkelbacteria bacterium Licking1014_7]